MTEPPCDRCGTHLDGHHYCRACYSCQHCMCCPCGKPGCDDCEGLVDMWATDYGKNEPATPEAITQARGRLADAVAVALKVAADYTLDPFRNQTTSTEGIEK